MGQTERGGRERVRRGAAENCCLKLGVLWTVHSFSIQLLKGIHGQYFTGLPFYQSNKTCADRQRNDAAALLIVITPRVIKLALAKVDSLLC